MHHRKVYFLSFILIILGSKLLFCLLCQLNSSFFWIMSELSFSGFFGTSLENNLNSLTQKFSRFGWAAFQFPIKRFHLSLHSTWAGYPSMVCILRCIISSEGWGIVYPANTTWIQSEPLNCRIERRHFSRHMCIWCCFKANSYTVKPRSRPWWCHHWSNSKIYRIQPPPLTWNRTCKLVQYAWSLSHLQVSTI